MIIMPYTTATSIVLGHEANLDVWALSWSSADSFASLESDSESWVRSIGLAGQDPNSDRIRSNLCTHVSMTLRGCLIFQHSYQLCGDSHMHKTTVLTNLQCQVERWGPVTEIPRNEPAGSTQIWPIIITLTRHHSDSRKSLRLQGHLVVGLSS